MNARTCLAIVLAAGEGTRMRSACRRRCTESAGARCSRTCLARPRRRAAARSPSWSDPTTDAVAKARKRVAPKAKLFEQRERRGTAHAVLAARKAIARKPDDILVMFADTPLVRPATLAKLRAALRGGAAVAVLGFRPTDPTGYGRLLTRGDELLAIREERDASADERKIGFCNGGLMALAGKHALSLLDRIGNANAKGEYYLSDAVAIARDMGLKAVAIETSEDDVRGINTKAQLAEAEAVLQQRLRNAAMEAGVTMVAPETVFLSADTKFGKDVTIEPNVVFGPGVTVEDGATIRSFSHLEGAHVGKGARVGPFARLRPGAELGRDVHIGNFVEVKAVQDRGRRQGQSPRLYRRCARGRGRQYRRRHHHLQLRRRRQAPHRYRQGRLHRLEFRAGGAGQDRRRRLCRLRLGDHQGRAGRRAGVGARQTGD